MLHPHPTRQTRSLPTVKEYHWDYKEQQRRTNITIWKTPDWILYFQRTIQNEFHPTQCKQYKTRIKIQLNGSYCIYAFFLKTCTTMHYITTSPGWLQHFGSSILQLIFIPLSSWMGETQFPFAANPSHPFIVDRPLIFPHLLFLLFLWKPTIELTCNDWFWGSDRGNSE